jgi:hypothetical protein
MATGIYPFSSRFKIAWYYFGDGLAPRITAGKQIAS